jgi:hypothetical protein
MGGLLVGWLVGWLVVYFGLFVGNYKRSSGGIGFAN